MVSVTRWPPYSTLTWCPMCGEVVVCEQPGKPWPARHIEGAIVDHMRYRHSRRYWAWTWTHWNWLITWPRKKAVSL